MDNPRRLPVGYTQLAYIESDGNQYIDTGFKYNSYNKVRYDVEFQYTSTFNDMRGLYGTYDGDRSGTIWIASGNFRVSIAESNSGMSAYNFPFDLNKHTSSIEINRSTNKYKLVFDGQQKDEVSFQRGSLLNSSNNIEIFRSMSGFSGSPVRIYKFRIYANGSLVRDFIPCKNSSSQIGLYDRRNRVFYQNAGTGSFKEGPIVFALPQEYQQVEYISSQGKAYINTNVYLDWTKSFDIQMKIDSSRIDNTSALWCSAFGYRLGSNDTLGLFLLPSQITLNYYGGGDIYVNKGLHTYRITKTQFTVDSTVKNATWTYPDNLETAPQPLWYGQIAGNPGIRNNYLDLYQLDIKQNGAYIRRLIPCYRRIDACAGMYDIVNDIFYESSGTEQFVPGPVIEDSFSLNEINGAIQKNVLGPTYTLVNDGCIATKLCGPSFNSMYKITYGDTSNKRVQVIGPWQGGPKWTYSCWARAESGSQTVRFSRSCNMYFTTVTLDQQWKRINGTIDTGGEFNLTLSIQPSGNIYIADLRLESNSVDSVQLNGYCNNVCSAYDNGKFCVDFRNNTGYIKIDLTGNNLSNCSISWWGKYTNQNALLISKSANGAGYVCACNDSNSTFYHKDAGSGLVVYKDGKQTSGKYDTDGWHHYCVTGVNLTGWTCAYLNYYANYNQKSCIRDFSIYDNALTKEEVQEIYENSL